MNHAVSARDFPNPNGWLPDMDSNHASRPYGNGSSWAEELEDPKKVMLKSEVQGITGVSPQPSVRRLPPSLAYQLNPNATT
jgi:hypothetical protein